MKALLGRKLGMSRIFSENGEVVPVTLIAADDNIITLKRTSEKDGYAAVQLALPKKAQHGEQKPTSDKSGLKPNEAKRTYALRREFRGETDETSMTVEQFDVGDTIQVAGVSKGKGFAGVVKRHHFKGGPKSHGHRHVLRRPGSIGGRYPQHVFKGMRMAGRMGGERVTVKNLQVVHIDADKKTIAVKGAVPGTRGGLVALYMKDA